jgi:hypothetical protein
VLDKEAGNFCDFFAFTEQRGQASSATTATSARAQLEALFKKKS